MFIEILYAEPDRVFRKTLELPMGTTAIEAVGRSGLLKEFDNVVISRERLAVFGRRVSPEQVLRDGDRVEVLRPLAISAAEARRLRAAKRDS